MPTSTFLSANLNRSVLGILLLLPFVLSGCGRIERQLFHRCYDTEPNAMIGRIRSAEEAYRAENLHYLDVSSSGNFYPHDSPTYSPVTFNDQRQPWDNPSAKDYNRWRELEILSDGPVRLGYRVSAGQSGTTPPTPPFPIADWPTRPLDEPWYVIEVLGNPENQRIPVQGVAASFVNEIFWRDP